MKIVACIKSSIISKLLFQVNKVEVDWAGKLIDTLRRFKWSSNADVQISKPVNTLGIRVKDILAPLNRDFNYRYCFNSESIEGTLRFHNNNISKNQQSINRLNDTSSARSVDNAMQMIRKRLELHERQEQERLDQEGVLRQNKRHRESGDLGKQDQLVLT